MRITILFFYQILQGSAGHGNGNGLFATATVNGDGWLTDLFHSTGIDITTGR